MIPSFVHGCIAPLFTAFNADGSLDDAGQREMLDYMEAAGSVDAYFVRSGLGQMYTFGLEEVKQIARTVCGHIGRRTPVLVGVSGIWNHDPHRRPDPKTYFRQAAELCRHAQDCGAAGVVHTIPDALVPPAGSSEGRETVRYFEELSRQTDLPLFVYQTPMTGSAWCVDEETVRQLATIDRLAGMKVSTNDAETIFNIAYALRGTGFALISGAETSFLTGLLFGARAAIGQGTTVYPQIVRRLQERYEAGSLKEAIELQHTVNMLVQKTPRVTEFFKRYLREIGYRIEPTARRGAAPYGVDDAPLLSAEQYGQAKRLLLEAFERHGIRVPGKKR
jgi:dihydrodipicolinate synthase/N-acetylneuraminate lyase